MGHAMGKAKAKLQLHAALSPIPYNMTALIYSSGGAGARRRGPFGFGPS
jgi:hypothetical protein